jgi:hypothetical protein
MPPTGQHRRTWLAVLGAVLMLTAAPAASAQPSGAALGPAVRHVEDLFVGRVARSALLADAWLAADTGRSASARSPQPCNDKAFTLEGGRWRSAYQWSFRVGSTPAGLDRAAAAGAIRRGVDNIVNANNDCGRADRVSARARYLGTTTRKPSCNISDGYNVVGFRKLPAGTAARACWWYIGNRIVEGDIQFNSNERWATSLAGCRNQLMLEAVMTHEAGHIFGLGHVGERRHGRLTMSTFIDGACQNSESTLGLGDMLGLERLYP